MLDEERYLAYLLGEDSPDVMLYNGDCLEEMKRIPDGSVDAIIADTPYGVVGCEWDAIIPFEPMWEQLKRVRKRNAVTVMTGTQPFTSSLIMSNVKEFRYIWVWDKKVASNSQLARTQPLKVHEDIIVFGRRGGKYNPQGVEECAIVRTNDNRNKPNSVGHVYCNKSKEYVQKLTGYPKSIQNFKPCKYDKQHPTEKPVALMEYLIKTYTDEGDTVLDFTMGSGTTGVAAVNLNRKFIGIELSKEYFEIAKERILK